MGKTVEEMFIELSHELTETLDRGIEKLRAINHQLVPSIIQDLCFEDNESGKKYRAVIIQGVRKNIVDTAQLLMQSAISEAGIKSKSCIANDYLRIDHLGDATINPEEKLGGYSVN